MHRWSAAILLTGTFIAAVVRSGWQTTHVILRYADSEVAPGFIEYSFAPLSAAAATLLACLICLTPGTTVVDVDPAGRMLLHVLDVAKEQDTLREIRERFEPLVRELFKVEVRA